MNAVKSVDIQSPSSPSPEVKEQTIRAWIAKKESVCPYAPGLARFIQLPEINTLDMSHVYYLAKELNAFYTARENGKRVGRWMLMPHQEWQTHDEAHRYSERLFWLINAAYFHLLGDKKSVQAAMKQQLSGYNRGHKGEILNPIIGHQPNRNAKVVPARSLFYSALSPLYNSKKFYRYCPHSIIPMVYASEFQELKDKHPNVSESVAFDMAVGGLYELYGDDLELDLEAFKQELPIWGAMIDRIAEIMRAARLSVSTRCDDVKGCPASNLSYFRLCQPQLLNALFTKYSTHMPVLAHIARQTRAPLKQIVGSCFAGSGLYTIPDYEALNG